MKETLKYIEVLNWGYGGFAPMTLGQDFEKSLQQVEERLALLDGLDYGALFVEATSPNGKANLEKYKKTDADFEYQLHFMRDRQILLDAIPTMYKCFKDGADKFRADGLWTDEQWREYRGAICELERAFELRLKQFATAYDYPLSDDPNSPEPQQSSLEYYCQKAIEKGYLTKTDTGYKRVIWSKAQLAYFLNHFLNIDGTFPDKDYCLMFGESRLSKAADQLRNNETGGGKPRGYEIVDELLQE